MKTFKELREKLSKSNSVEDWIKDFMKSDAPQFKGKSEEEKRKMAIAAYYSAQNEVVEDAPANAVAHGGVDLNPTGKPKKMDKRSKYHIEKMFRRAQGNK